MNFGERKVGQRSVGGKVRGGAEAGSGFKNQTLLLGANQISDCNNQAFKTISKEGVIII
jgi:hypothetical protein